MTGLFDTLAMGDVVLANRVIMAPLTRMRSKHTWQYSLYSQCRILCSAGRCGVDYFGSYAS